VLTLASMMRDTQVDPWENICTGPAAQQQDDNFLAFVSCLHCINCALEEIFELEPVSMLKTMCKKGREIRTNPPSAHFYSFIVVLHYIPTIQLQRMRNFCKHWICSSWMHFIDVCSIRTGWFPFS
jgi:hypothetical protein